MRLRFLGAAGAVTGSRSLVTSGSTRLLVDCGMYQGVKRQRLRNWQPLDTDVSALDAVVLTHAHLDHSGWLPALVRDGFEGPVYCTAGTEDLLGVLLPDSGRIQEEDAAYANRKGFSKHKPALPMYTEADAHRALARLEAVPWNTDFLVGDLSLSLHPVGHIVGASCVRVADADTSVLFSGDVGRPGDLVMQAPPPPPASRYLVLESTYGARSHPPVDLLTSLSDAIGRTLERGGTVLIPSFAVGRAQAVLYAVDQLQREGRLPDVPVVLDSPMAVDATGLYLRHAGELRLKHASLGRLKRRVQLVRSLEESKALNQRTEPMILVSASGMLAGGRVLHHLARLAPARKNLLLFVGFQAPGTRGAGLVAGAERVKIHGRYVKVRCEVVEVGGMSAHADADELVSWAAGMPEPPDRVWLNHGEPAAADALRCRLVDDLGWRVEVATEGVEWLLEDAEVELAPSDRPIAPTPAGPARTPAFLASEELAPVRRMVAAYRAEHALVERDIGGLVLVAGSATAVPDGLRAGVFQQARELGMVVGTERLLRGEPVAVATVGSTGVAAAVHEGAGDVGASSVVLAEVDRRLSPATILLQLADPAVRRELCDRRTRALVAFPGGVGTLAEVFGTLERIRVREIRPIPVVVVGAGFWDQALDLARLQGERLITPEVAGLVRTVESVEEAWQAIQDWFEPARGAS